MPRFDGRELAASFGGGCAGALARAALAEAFPAGPGQWPWPTFAVNVLGAFLLGYLATRLQERLPLSRYRRPLLGTARTSRCGRPDGNGRAVARSPRAVATLRPQRGTPPTKLCLSTMRRRRSKIERLRGRGDVRRLVAMLDRRDWLVTGEHAVDLEVERRVEAVTALGSIDTPDAEAGVVYALRDSDVRVLLAAVRALGPAPSPRAAKELASAAATWRDPAYDAARAAAIQLLVDAGDELYAVEYAQTLVDDERRSSLRPEEKAAVRALFAADSGSVAELMADDLALSLGAADERERELAFQTLVALGPVSVRALISALDDPDRRRSAAAALGAVRDSRAVPALTKLLSNPDAPTRAAAARALGQIRDPGAIDGLVGVSADPDPDVRDAALDALDGMRGLLLAILGTATAHAGEQPDRLRSPDHAGEVGAPRLPEAALQRSLLQRLLGHER